jgi:hypothetical protein
VAILKFDGSMHSYFIYDFINNLRYQIRPSTGRNVIKIGKFVVKVHRDLHEAFYEYQNLTEIALSRPKLFKVPNAITLVKGQGVGAIIMEYVPGHNLDNYVLDYLLRRNMNITKIFYKIGKVLREFHNLKLNNLKNSSLPVTDLDLKSEIMKLSKDLVEVGLINEELFDKIFSAIKKVRVDDKIFAKVNLHGEFYFTHVMLHNGEIVFIDLHNMQRGPLYFDVAMFNISLYSSLMFLPWNPKSLIPLTRAFLIGYLGWNDDYFIMSLSLAELYIALREILSHVRMLCVEESLVRSISSLFKIEKFKSIIKEVILPQLEIEK